jgi:hypothetical protein
MKIEKEFIKECADEIKKDKEFMKELDRLDKSAKLRRWVSE